MWVHICNKAIENVYGLDIHKIGVNLEGFGYVACLLR